MINAKKLIKTLLEYSYADLAKMADAGRDERSLGLLVSYIGIDQGEHGHVRTFWEVESGSKPGKHYKCVVEFHVPGGMFNIGKGKWKLKDFHKALSKADVRVHCNCPDFYWSGMKYNTGKAGKYKGSLSPGQNAGYKGEPDMLGDDLKPTIRDPEERNVICKHLLVLKRNIGSYTTSFMKDIKNYDDKIEVNDEIARKLDEGKRALSKDIMVEVSDQEAKQFIDPIVHAPEPDPKKEEEREVNAEKVIETESAPVKEEPKEGNVADIIDEESEPTPEPEVPELEPEPEPEVPEPEPKVPEPEAEVPEEIAEEKAAEGAEELINDKNETVQNEEETEENEEENVLEKDKKDSDVADPNTVLGR